MNKSDSLREQIASLCHEQWSEWMRDQMKKVHCEEDKWVVPGWVISRWCGQMNTPYEELDEVDKEDDRKEADRFIELWDGERVKIPTWEVEIMSNGALSTSCFRKLEAEYFNVHDDGRITFWNYGEQRREQVAAYAPAQWYGVRRKDT